MLIDTLMNPGSSAPPLILASGSETRADILRAAGLTFDILRPTVDEAAVRLVMIEAKSTVAAGASRLADLKALEVSAGHPDALVIGADQILECDGRWFEKPESLPLARTQLEALSGKRHHLISAVSVARGNQVVWSHVDQASLAMRPLGSVFLDRYLGAMGARALSSVGGYQFEGLGAQLFDSIQGDHYTILGLPLLPLLGFLRDNDVLGK